MSPRQPTPVDGHVGGRLREIRNDRQMTQEELGSAVGLSFKQIRKYEHGENRISSSMLFNLSKALDVEINAFFERISGNKPDVSKEDGLVKTRETEQLVQQYYRTSNTTKRTAFLSVVRAIADSEDNV